MSDGKDIEEQMKVVLDIISEIVKGAKNTDDPNMFYNDTINISQFIEEIKQLQDCLDNSTGLANNTVSRCKRLLMACKMILDTSTSVEGAKLKKQPERRNIFAKMFMNIQLIKF